MNVYGSTLASGGGGTSDYSDLSNKPSINGVTLSGNKTSSALGINSPISYSTSEQNTGTTWIDGKTIYQKTVELTVPTTTANGIRVDSTTAWSTLGISSIAKVIYIEGFIYNSTNNIYRPMNVTQTDSDAYMTPKNISMVSNISSGIVLTNTIAAFSGMKAYVTLKYTKS